MRRALGAGSVAAAAAIVFGAFGAREARAQGLEPPPTIPPGMAAPPPNLPPGAPTGSATSSDESQDSGLGLEWVWLNADVGAAYVNMSSFDATHLAVAQSSSSGPAFGVGAGIRLIFFTLGLRVRDLQLSAFNLWEVNAEAAFHTRIWRIDPYFGVRGGYAFVGTFSSNSVQVATGSSASDVAVHGFDLGPMMGIDFYLAKLVSIGVEADVPFLFLQRPVPPLPTLPPGVVLTAQEQELYKQSGSSVGFGVTGTAHLGVHF